MVAELVAGTTVGGVLTKSLTASAPVDLRSLLRDVEGHTNEEVAESLGLTLPTVKARLHRARLFLRQDLETYFSKL